jgi:hypothetical protein
MRAPDEDEPEEEEVDELVDENDEPHENCPWSGIA